MSNATNAPPKTLVGSTMVGKVLGMSRQTVHRYAIEGKIPIYSRLPSGFLRFNLAEIQELKTQWNRANIYAEESAIDD